MTIIETRALEKSTKSVELVLSKATSSESVEFSKRFYAANRLIFLFCELQVVKSRNWIRKFSSKITTNLK